MRRIRTGLLAWCLAVLLTVSAVAVSPEQTAARKTDLDFLWTTLQETHPNLFANTSKTVFQERKTEIESHLDTVDDITFLLDLQSLTALAKDSHTTLNIGRIMELDGCTAYPMALQWFDGHWYLSAVDRAHEALLGSEVAGINGQSISDVVTAFGTIASADNPVKLRRNYRQTCNMANLYEYLNLIQPGEDLILSLIGGETLSLAPLDMDALSKIDVARLEVSGTAETVYDKSKAYFAKPLDQHTLYIQYNQCREDPELPMETFAAQVQPRLTEDGYSRVVIDLRNNGGGSDGVIVPLLNVLRPAMDDGTEVVGLIGETTFSSAIINAVELQEMGAVLVGEPTSGSVSHFGSVSSTKLPEGGDRLGISSKYIEMGDLLDAAVGLGVESLTPDVTVSQTLEDYQSGRDACVDYLTAHPEPLSQRGRSDAPLTRGRFVGQIWTSLGKPTVSADASIFPDLFGIEWYLQSVQWAVSAGVAKGNPDGNFSAARPLTWQEAAVFLTRAAKISGKTLQSVRTEPLPDLLTTAAWNHDAVESAWRQGLLPDDADFSQPPTRTQGEQMAAMLQL